MKIEFVVLVQVGWWTRRLLKREPGDARLVMLSQYCDIDGSTGAVVTWGGGVCWEGAGGSCGGGIAEACATGGGCMTLVGPQHHKLELVSLVVSLGGSRSHAFQSSWLLMSATVRSLPLAYAWRI